MKLKYENPRLFWRAVKPHRSYDCPVTVDTFYTYFSHSNSHSIQHNIHVDTQPQKYLHYVEELDHEYTVLEVSHAISRLKHNKSPGYDNVLNECLLYCSKSIVCIITCILNFLLNLGIFPECWECTNL